MKFLTRYSSNFLFQYVSEDLQFSSAFYKAKASR